MKVKSKLIGKPLTFDAHDMIVGETKRVSVFAPDGKCYTVDVRLIYKEIGEIGEIKAVGMIANTKHNATIIRNTAYKIVAENPNDPIRELITALPWVSEKTAARAIKRAGKDGIDGIARWGGKRLGAGRKRNAVYKLI